MRPWITFVFKSTCFLFPWGFLLTLLQKNLLDSLQAFVLIIVQFSRSCISLSRWQLCYYSSFTINCQLFFAAFTFFLLFLQLFHHFLGFLQPFLPFSFSFCHFITLFMDVCRKKCGTSRTLNNILFYGQLWSKTAVNPPMYGAISHRVNRFIEK